MANGQSYSSNRKYSSRFEKTSFGNIEEDINTFKGEIYAIPKGTDRLPDFTELKPIGKIFTPQLEVEKQSFKKGFPDVTDRFEYFAIDFKSQFYLDKEEELIFSLGSDDGSKLIIDGKVIIDNDFSHLFITKEGKATLSKGIHRIEVQYFQGPKYNVGLILKYKKPHYKKFYTFNLSKINDVKLDKKGKFTTVTFNNNFNYDSNNYELDEKSKFILEQLKKSNIDGKSIRSLTIKGHTDNLGSHEYNVKLSNKRCQSVKSFLTELGIDQDMISSKAMGETKPAYSNETEYGRRKNRRIEISFFKK